MIWFLKLCVFPIVLIDFQRLLVEAGYTTWKVMEVPLVFGGDAVIHCMYHNNLSCTDQVFWTWTTEPNNDIIMTNGTLSEKYKNGKKYSERRSSCTQYSNLVISNFSEIDYRKKYKCGIANINSPESSFVEYSKEEITFEKISYEYVPAQKMVSTVLDFKIQQVSFSLKINKIYPVPECQATFADTDITNALTVEKKKVGLFYNVAVTYTTSDLSMTSFGDLCIRCNGSRKQWKSVDPFCKKKSDLTSESNLVDISPVEDLTTERNLVKSTVEGMTMERNCIDISPLNGFYLAAIVFVGVFYILYPVAVVVVIVRLYYASKDQFNRTKQILSRIENISNVCIGSSLMFGVLTFGGLHIKVGPELPIQLELGMNVFSTVAILCPFICSLLIVSVRLFAVRKLSKKNRCSMYGQFIPLTVPLGVFIALCILAWKVTSTMVWSRTYFHVYFYWMPIDGIYFLTCFVLSKNICMKSIERLHKTTDGRLHRKTGNSGRNNNASNSQHDEEIRERSDSVDTASNNQNNEEMRELVVLKDPNGQGDEEMDTDV